MASVNDLLKVLRASGDIAAADLRLALRVDGARLSRLVDAAGAEVFRAGKARASRYGLYREVTGLGRDAPLFEVGQDGAPREAGRLSFLHRNAFWLTFGDQDAYQVALPAFLEDCAPQGFLGQLFSTRFPELGLPHRLERWTSDDRVRAMALRGEDAVGNLVLGSTSFERLLRLEPAPVTARQYPALAEGVSSDRRGSSAGGERPKLTAFSGGRHVLVKFAAPGGDAASRRWRDLLRCEHLALEVIQAAGAAAAARSRCLEVAGWTFLELERFDRVGARGRIGVRSLGALCKDAGLPPQRPWTSAAFTLAGGRAPRFRREDLARVAWLDAFGGLIADTDRHPWNLSFLVTPSGGLELAPAYDVLPMAFAPLGHGVLNAAFDPAAQGEEGAYPHPLAPKAWRAAVPWALRYWATVGADRGLEGTLRAAARAAADAVERLAERLG